ncbi:MAG: hypothetical protein L3K02_04030 [Thermoplasmata archaeon]|nr:hypothetical protein [Thermoplasmata archaeon]
MVQRDRQPTDSRWWKAPEFVRSLPLFGLAAVFFVAGGVLRFAYPTYALYGPGVFTFWALLLALGFTCTIGAVVSWTLAGDSTPAALEATTPAPTPAYLPIDFPEPESMNPEPARPARGRTDFGRPMPDVRPTSAGGDWYEGPTDTERFVGPQHVRPVELPPLPDSMGQDPAETEPVEQVLADLERIERDLAPRARIVDPSPS